MVTKNNTKEFAGAYLRKPYILEEIGRAVHTELNNEIQR
jgi:hypothetical protein